jgi:hypothetical protein
MSAGLWFFFNWAGAPVNTHSAIASVVLQTSGSGAWPYRPLDDDYWRLWATRFSPVDLAPHASFDLQAQLTDLRQRLALKSASAVAEATLSAELDALPTPSLF